MNEKKNFGKFILFLASLLLAVSVLLFTGYRVLCALETVYDDSFYAALKTKYDRLNSIDEPKIVVIGGSSVAFGIDSKLVEQETGMPAVNFGLYAAIGLKPMLDLSKKAVHSGDIIIIAPELSAQMYSDYIGYDYLLEAIEGRPDMGTALGWDYAKGFLRSLPKFLKNRNEILKNGLNIEGVYASRSFDEAGDLRFPRTENTMNGGFSKTNLPEFSSEILTDGFFEMVNAYAGECRAKGASVYFSFPPVNERSLEYANGDPEAFVRKSEERLEFGILSSLEDHWMDPGYFYDSNFHTNDAGTVYNTVLLVNDLQRVTGRMTARTVEVPEPLPIETESELREVQSDGIFTYALSEKGMVVKGLTGEGKALENLTVPDRLGGYPVVGIDAFAFENAAAVQITLPETVLWMQEGLFRNASSLRTVYLNFRSLPEVSSDLLALAPEDLKLYVPKEVYGKFVTDYFWGAFSGCLRPFE